MQNMHKSTWIIYKVHQRKKQKKGRCKNTPFLNKDPTNLWSPPKAASAYVYLNPHREIFKADVFIFYFFFTSQSVKRKQWEVCHQSSCLDCFIWLFTKHIQICLVIIWVSYCPSYFTSLLTWTSKLILFRWSLCY